jgi:hypothetical protein
MAVTFTQVGVRLRFNETVLAEVVKELSMMLDNTPNRIISVETAFHVNSIERADIVLKGLDKLKALGAIDQNDHSLALNQTDAFKRMYLK